MEKLKKKKYEKPFAEKVAFGFRNQVIASNASVFGSHYCIRSRENQYLNGRETDIMDRLRLQKNCNKKSGVESWQ